MEDYLNDSNIDQTFNISETFIYDELPPNDNNNTFVIGLCICMIIFLFLGVYGNVVSTLIFMHPIMKSPIDVLLTGLSIIDLFLIILAIPVYFLPSLNTVLNNEFIQSVYSFTAVVLYPFALMTQTCSIWTFVLVSIERYLAICQPLKRHKLLTCKEAKFAQITVAIFSFLYNICRFWEYKWVTVTDGLTNKSRADQWLRANTMYFYFYYTLLYEITHFVVPFFLIFVLNLFIVRSLHRSPTNLRRFTRSQMQQRKTSSMIVVITMMFALCNACPFIMNIWEAIDNKLFDNKFNHSWRSFAFVIGDVSNCLVILNSASTFIIYLMCCRKYRVLFKFYGRFRRPIGGGQFLLNEDNNVHCALIQAAMPCAMRLTAMAYNLDERKNSFSTDPPNRSDSTTYSSTGGENGK